MKNKILKNRASVLTFTFLLSGNIIHGLFYSSGNPVVCFLAVSAVLITFTKLASAYFLRHETIKSVKTACFFAIATGIFMVVPFSYTVQIYVRSLGTFSAFYATVPAVIFAVLSAVFLGTYSAYKGERSVYGFSRMIYIAAVIWILSGAFGLLYTKKLVPLYSPVERLSDTNWLEVLKNIALITFDTVFLFITLTDNRSKSDKKELCSGVCAGTLIFVVVSGLNLLKNLIIFGADFAKRLESPDLAAIRLIPMFELPELGVIINTFAVTVRGAVYICALLFMLKDCFGENYKSKKVLPAVFAVFSTLSVIFCLFLENSEPLAAIAAISVVLSSGASFVLFGSKEKM